MKNIFYLLISILIFLSCSQRTESTTNNKIVEIDLTKDFPQKTINLRDIADIKYIPLETTDESILGITNKFVYTDSLIIIEDFSQQAIFIFDTKGKYINSFCHKGAGPHEYLFINDFCVDASKKEIYIAEGYDNRHRFIVYDYKGNYLREFNYPKRIIFQNLFNHNDEYMLAYNTAGQKGRFLTEEYPYILISKKNGEIKPLNIRIENGFTNSIDHYNPTTQAIESTALPMCSMIKTRDGAIISDYANDTIYYVVGSTIKPIATRKNIHISSKEYHLSTVGFENERFLSLYSIKIVSTSEDERSFTVKDDKNLLYDKQTGEIFEFSFALPDYYEKYKSSSWNKWYYETTENVVIRNSSMSLLVLYKEAQGELKEIIANRTEEDNPVLVVAKFKE